MKKIYEKPSLMSIGPVGEVTRATSAGGRFDGNFSRGQSIPPNIARS